MLSAFLTYIKTTAGKHLAWLVFAVVAFVVGRSWLAEHDARLQSDATVKVVQTQITDLKAQQTTVAQVAKVQVVQLQAAAAKVQTAPEAIAALPSVEPEGAAPLNAAAVPGDLTEATVQAVPLYEDLNVCKQTAVKLGACTETLDLQTKIDADKDTQIAALKKKPSFWKRVAATGKAVGIGVGIGIALAIHK